MHAFVWETQITHIHKERKGGRTNQALTASESPERPCAFPACRPNTGWSMMQTQQDSCYTQTHRQQDISCLKHKTVN